uniref:Uncharacterized protein n=1 Tax=Romanomermis culicivorax TaxID=13658 RepID=A0A915HVI3_ROMCU
MSLLHKRLCNNQLFKKSAIALELPHRLSLRNLPSPPLRNVFASLADPHQSIPCAESNQIAVPASIIPRIREHPLEPVAPPAEYLRRGLVRVRRYIICYCGDFANKTGTPHYCFPSKRKWEPMRAAGNTLEGSLPHGCRYSRRLWRVQRRTRISFSIIKSTNCRTSSSFNDEIASVYKSFENGQFLTAR